MKKIALLISMAALAFPAAAVASWAPVIPPGNSGADQYVESVPSASGNDSSGAVRSHRPSTGSALATQPGAVTPVTQAALLAQGRPGRLTAQLASTTGPRGLSAQTKVTHSKHKAKTAVGGAANPGGPSAGGGSAAGGGGSSAVGSVAGALTGTGGASVLPFVLAATALAIVAIAVARRRLN
jgi:hypothetical protein